GCHGAARVDSRVRGRGRPAVSGRRGAAERAPLSSARRARRRGRTAAASRVHRYGKTAGAVRGRHCRLVAELDARDAGGRGVHPPRRVRSCGSGLERPVAIGTDRRPDGGRVARRARRRGFTEGRRARRPFIRRISDPRLRRSISGRSRGPGAAGSADGMAGLRREPRPSRQERHPGVAPRGRARAARRRPRVPRAADRRSARRAAPRRARARSDCGTHARTPGRRSAQASARRTPGRAGAVVPAEMFSRDGRAPGRAWRDGRGGRPRHVAGRHPARDRFRRRSAGGDPCEARGTRASFVERPARRRGEERPLDSSRRTRPRRERRSRDRRAGARFGCGAMTAYCTLTIPITGVMRYWPLPTALTDWLPSKSSVTVVAVADVRSNSRLSFTSPEATWTAALPPGGGVSVAPHAAPVEAESKYTVEFDTTRRISV